MWNFVPKVFIKFKLLRLVSFCKYENSNLYYLCGVPNNL